MDQVNIIGIDLAKQSFQLHGAWADGSVAFRKKLSRGKVLEFLASQPPSVVAMEACVSLGAQFRPLRIKQRQGLSAPIDVETLCRVTFPGTTILLQDDNRKYRGAAPKPPPYLVYQPEESG